MVTYREACTEVARNYHNQLWSTLSSSRSTPQLPRVAYKVADFANDPEFVLLCTFTKLQYKRTKFKKNLLGCQCKPSKEHQADCSMASYFACEPKFVVTDDMIASEDAFVQHLTLFPTMFVDIELRCAQAQLAHAWFAKQNKTK